MLHSRFQHEFLPEYDMAGKNHLQFGKSFAVSRGVYPFKRAYLPFFEQMTTQLTALMKQQTKQNFVKHFAFFFRTRAYNRMGDPFFIEEITENHVFRRKDSVYRGEFLKLHKDGFAYGSIRISSKKGFSESAEMWFRWKSNLPEYDYIEPDDALILRPEDITFEICKEVPEEYILRFYAKTAAEFDCGQWLTLINDPHNYPRKRSRKKTEFTWEISETWRYPDAVFTLFLGDKVTPEQQDAVLQEFVDFQEEWDTTHLWGIHDIGFAEVDCPEDAVKIAVDFGSSDVKIVKALIKWLQTGDLDIRKVRIE